MRGKSRKRGGDRRDQDVGPPSGWRERRHSVERRRPEVREISLTEWLACLPSPVLKRSRQT